MHDPSHPPAPSASSRFHPWRPLKSFAALLVAATLLAGLWGCSTFKPLPLKNSAGVRQVSQLSAPTSAMPIPAIASHRFDPSDGLDPTEVAMLAVVNSPALKLKRDALGLARAQAFAAGLLPDPQLGLGADFPKHSGPGLTTGFNLGISQEITALLTRSSRENEARGQMAQVNLELLWSEWQTVTQARQLFDQIMTLRAQQQRLHTEKTALMPVARYVRMALDAGDLTYDSASAGLNAEAEVRKRLADTTVQRHQAESDLRVLLGLNVDAPMPLVSAGHPASPTAAQIQQALAELPQRRPDLLALQAGYAAQNAKLRGAILAQFPALTLGFNTARDTGDVYSHGLSIGISLPIFNRNRGNIAIEQATRLQLKDTYDERLLSARADVQRLQANLATLNQQTAAAQSHMHELDAARRAAETAWHAQLLDWPTYLGIRSNALMADLDGLNLRQQRDDTAIALQALLGNTDVSTAITMSPP